jgi:hypothetical protein
MMIEVSFFCRRPVFIDIQLYDISYIKSDLCVFILQPALRAAAVGALNAWVDQTTLIPLAECEAFSDALKLENPNLRQEVS